MQRFLANVRAPIAFFAARGERYVIRIRVSSGHVAIFVCLSTNLRLRQCSAMTPNESSVIRRKGVAYASPRTMGRLVRILTSALAVGVCGCGGSGAKPASVGELQATFARHGLHTFVVYDREQPLQRASGGAVPVLVRGFPWKRFAPAFALIADRERTPPGSLPGTVRVEAYVFGTTAEASAAARACVRCLAARNVVVVVRDPWREHVEAALSELR